MTTREHYSKQFDDIIEALKNDKEKILDTLIDYCCGYQISFHLSRDGVPSYSVSYTKIAVNQIMKRQVDYWKAEAEAKLDQIRKENNNE